MSGDVVGSSPKKRKTRTKRTRRRKSHWVLAISSQDIPSAAIASQLLVSALVREAAGMSPKSKRRAKAERDLLVLPVRAQGPTTSVPQQGTR